MLGLLCGLVIVILLEFESSVTTCVEGAPMHTGHALALAMSRWATSRDVSVSVVEPPAAAVRSAAPALPTHTASQGRMCSPYRAELATCLYDTACRAAALIESGLPLQH